MARCDHDAALKEVEGAHPPAPSDSRARDHMANTRTLLAWIRTSVALIGLGFVVARFGLFLRALDAQAGHGAASASPLSGVIGVGLVLIGVLVGGLSLRRFRQIEGSIEAGHFRLDVSVELITAGAVIIAGLALATYLVLTK